MQLLNRRSPFGLELLASVSELPQYFLKTTEVEITSSGGQKPVEIDLMIECGLLVEPSSGSSFKAKKNKGRSFTMTVLLTLTSDMDFIDFRRIPCVHLTFLIFFFLTGVVELKL